MRFKEEPYKPSKCMIHEILVFKIIKTLTPQNILRALLALFYNIDKKRLSTHLSALF